MKNKKAKSKTASKWASKVDSSIKWNCQMMNSLKMKVVISTITIKPTFIVAAA